jgi:hypothetical protein
MTKKDYVRIAAALRDTLLINLTNQDQLVGAKAAHISACNRIADALAADNPKFDRARFLAACSVKS